MRCEELATIELILRESLRHGLGLGAIATRTGIIHSVQSGPRPGCIELS